MPSDRGHASLVEIAKWLGVFAANHSENVASGVTSLLHRHWRDSGQRLSSLMRKIRQVTNHLYLRMSGNGEVLVHNDTADAVNRCAHCFPDERCIVSGRPNLHAARDEFAVQLHP